MGEYIVKNAAWAIMNGDVIAVIRQCPYAAGKFLPLLVSIGLVEPSSRSLVFLTDIPGDRHVMPAIGADKEIGR